MPSTASRASATGTRERILQVAKELGWKPSLRAKGLSSAKAYALGLVVARDPRLSGNGPLLPGVHRRHRNHPGRTRLHPGAERRHRARRGGTLLPQAGRRTAGWTAFILTDVRHDDSRIALLQELKLPAVTLNRPDAARPFPQSAWTTRDGITAAVEHLIALGHTRIAHVGGGQEYIHGRSRRQAWEDSAGRAGLAPTCSPRRTSPPPGGVAATAELLRPGGPAHGDRLRQ